MVARLEPGLSQGRKKQNVLHQGLGLGQNIRLSQKCLSAGITVFLSSKVCTFFIENDAEILPAH